MTNRKSMPLLTELEELMGACFSIKISLLSELANIRCSVFFGARESAPALTMAAKGGVKAESPLHPQLWRIVREIARDAS
jgi:hypothetical protein